MDTIFAILFFIVAAVISAVMKKKQSQEKESDDWPASDSQDTASEGPQQGGWEEELRRLLEGTEPTTSAPPPQPTLVRRESTPAPAPPPVPTQPWLPSATTPPLTSSILSSAIESQKHAGSLHDRAKARLKRASDKVRFHTKTATKTVVASEIDNARNLLKTPGSIRTAWIASFILAKPRALDPYK